MSNYKKVFRVFSLILLGCLVITAAHAQYFQQGSKLTGNDAIGSDVNQGYSSSLSADGNTIIVGGYGDSNYHGAAWIYKRSGGVWMQQGNKLVGTGAVGEPNLQGGPVGISGDGNTAIIGSGADNGGQGAAWIFVQSSGVWTQQGSKLVGTGAIGNAGQGCAVALSADGNTAIVGGNNDNDGQGAAWIFTRSGGAWTQQGSKLVGTGVSGAASQGYSVSLSADGNTALVGGYYDSNGIGAAWIFTRSGGTWTQEGGKLVGTGAVWSPVYQGWSASLSAEGNTAIIGGYADFSGMGAAWVFARSGGVWTQQGDKLVGTGSVGNANMGRSVSISADGNTVIIGGSTDNSSWGAAWIFKRSGGVWTQFGNKLVGNGTIGNAEQGESVSISADGSTAIVGGGNDNSKGAVWVFVLDDSPKPVIASVQDVANDQGGNVRVRWNKSLLDTAGGNPRLTSYYVWRKIPPGASPKTRLHQLLGITNDTLGTLYDVLVNVPAVGSTQYNVVAATLYDSSSSGNHDETFIVTGHTADMDVFWISDAMTGHSVDNLPPISPMNAQLTPMVNGPIQITWDANRVDPDVEKYVIYRSTQGGFVPSESNKLYTITDTSVVDYSCQIGEKYYYRVAAVDIHGNQSAPTGELSETAMPVQLNTMTARVISTGNVLIEWATISEVNNYGFYVERKGEHEVEFTTVSDFIPGSGTTLEAHAYSWTDATVSNGTYYYMLRQIGLDGNQTYSGKIAVTVTDALGVADEQAPRVFSLHQNYPNPFNPATQIKFTVEKVEHATVKIYNLMGQEAATLFDGVAEPGRYHTVVFNASRFSSAIYYCRIVTESRSAVMKMILMK